MSALTARQRAFVWRYYTHTYGQRHPPHFLDLEAKLLADGQSWLVSTHNFVLCHVTRIPAVKAEVRPLSPIVVGDTLQPRHPLLRLLIAGRLLPEAALHDLASCIELAGTIQMDWFYRLALSLPSPTPCTETLVRLLRISAVVIYMHEIVGARPYDIQQRWALRGTDRVLFIDIADRSALLVHQQVAVFFGRSTACSLYMVLLPALHSAYDTVIPVEEARYFETGEALVDVLEAVEAEVSGQCMPLSLRQLTAEVLERCTQLGHYRCRAGVRVE